MLWAPPDQSVFGCYLASASHATIAGLTKQDVNAADPMTPWFQNNSKIKYKYLTLTKFMPSCEFLFLVPPYAFKCAHHGLDGARFMVSRYFYHGKSWLFYRFEEFLNFSVPKVMFESSLSEMLHFIGHPTLALYVHI